MKPSDPLAGLAIPRQASSSGAADEPETLRKSILELASLPNAVPCARLHARHVLREWGLHALADTVELLVSELVTNGVKASASVRERPPVRLRLSATAQRVVLEVWDGSLDPPRPSEIDGDFPELDQESGRGLFLVENISERWGWYATSRPAGKVVWCILAQTSPLE